MTARHYPFLAFRFEVKVGPMAMGGFSECSGLQVRVETHDVVEGGLNTYVHRLPTRQRQNDIRLRRGLAGQRLWEWYSAWTAGRSNWQTCSILLWAENGTDVVAEWQVLQAWPVAWVGPELDATRSAVAVETVELAHTGVKRVR
ncbi:phage tail protein [Saccharothrix syringae]|uniref:Phage tail protein n=1 Tax=Saccharothrix syringae TaxID=103733 RepID=A0A5Q0GZ45_SACSY|nr:phage tail protein [Saccharothrix syringae]QFZ18652.1 phage tail protein [Saccharothrix syringae]